MSYPYHRHYSVNMQPGHQLYWDQVLESYPIRTDSTFTPGGFTAEGSVINWGSNCSVEVTDQYNNGQCCSTWASGAPTPGNMYCPCNTPSTPLPPPVSFALSLDQEMCILKNGCCK